MPARRAPTAQSGGPSVDAIDRQHAAAPTPWRWRMAGAWRTFLAVLAPACFGGRQHRAVAPGPARLKDPDAVLKPGVQLRAVRAERQADGGGELVLVIHGLVRASKLHHRASRRRARGGALAVVGRRALWRTARLCGPRVPYGAVVSVPHRDRVLPRRHGEAARKRVCGSPSACPSRGARVRPCSVVSAPAFRAQPCNVRSGRGPAQPRRDLPDQVARGNHATS